MNKNLSLAIKKAVRSYPTRPEIKKEAEERPDLFSLTHETELFQNEKGITLKINRSKDSKLTNFGKPTLSDRYLGLNESYQDLFARVASTYADNNLHGQRIYNYISNLCLSILKVFYFPFSILFSHILCPSIMSCGSAICCRMT